MDLLALIQNQISPQVTGNISKLVGENESTTTKALGGIVPTVLGSLAGKASTPGGAQGVMNMLNQEQSRGGLADSAGGLLSKITSGGGLNQFMSSSGNSQVTSLLGSKTQNVVDSISQSSGARPHSVMSLLAMAAPLVMGLLHKHATTENLGASGLGQLLTSQLPSIKNAMPAGLANTLGFGQIKEGVGERVDEFKEGARERAGDYKERFQTAEPAGRRELAGAGHRGFPSAAWLLIGILALGALFWGWRGHYVHQRRAAQAIVEPAGAQAGNTHVVVLPSGQRLRLSTGSAADQLATHMSSGNVSGTYDLSAVKFDRRGNVSADGQQSIKQIGMVLAASPGTSITITASGPTMDEGVKRANTVKSELVSEGVAADHIHTTGDVGDMAPTLKVGQ